MTCSARQRSSLKPSDLQTSLGTDCHTCEFDSVNAMAGSCAKCKNSKVQLADGTCADESACNGDVVGKGAFGRVCQIGEPEPVITTTTAVPEFVATTNCVGKVTSEGKACICNADCYTCEYDDINNIAGSCSKCKNSKVQLAHGHCGDESDCDGDVIGKGKFGRFCQFKAAATTEAPKFVATTTCVGKATDEGGACICNADCHTCEFDSVNAMAGSCSKCKNSKVQLADGTCADESACNGDVVGKGAVGRVCRVKQPTTVAPQVTTTTTTTTAAPEFVVTTTCVGKTTSEGDACVCNTDCHACAFDSINGMAGSCSKCKNSQHLFDGICLETCPRGFDEVGGGSFSRRCVESTRRSRRSVDSEVTAEAVQITGSSLIFAGFMSVLIVFAVSIIALLKTASHKQTTTVKHASFLPEDAVVLQIGKEAV